MCLRDVQNNEQLLYSVISMHVYTNRMNNCIFMRVCLSASFFHLVLPYTARCSMSESDARKDCQRQQDEMCLLFAK